MSHIYELDFVSNGVSQRAFVKLFYPTPPSSNEIKNLQRVEMLLGLARDVHGTHYVVIKKDGHFSEEALSKGLTEKVKKNLVRQARIKYWHDYNMYIGDPCGLNIFCRNLDFEFFTFTKSKAYPISLEDAYYHGKIKISLPEPELFCPV